ncbi:hypothetical protein [uncultured Dysosmobacter sp.]|uniref:hypothetical protein n=1 Tax=uncultured Dysosmobacter sp. TaxID=2591384 RepID=UPI0026261354|nr:hypothetical protein [uncultured Dysosmobacter sp.]
MKQKEIQAMMERAPQIEANSLSGDYRALAEYNNVILAGHETSFGMEFITWEWVQDHTSLWQGHYFGDNLEKAQKDFTSRSGLLPPERMFSDEQLAVIYDAAQNMTTLYLVSNPKQEKLLNEIMSQIEEAIPHVIDLANVLTQSPTTDWREMGGMTLG